MSRTDLVTLGEPLISLTAHGRLASAGALAKTVAGAESNLAIGLARLGLSACYVGVVGDDPFGEQIRRTLRGEGVDVQWLRRSATLPTGLMIKECLGPDEVNVHYYRRGSAVTELDASGVSAELVAGAQRAHVSGVTLALGDGPAGAALALLRLASAAGVATSFDPNFRRKLWSDAEAATACAEVLPLVDDLLLGADEAEAIVAALGYSGGDLVGWLGALHEAGVERVVIRRGAAGAVGSVRGGAPVDVPPVPSTVVDTVGAGDAFTAGYLFGLLTGRAFDVALRAGAFAAARVIGHSGDYEGFPDLRELARFEAGDKEVHR